MYCSQDCRDKHLVKEHHDECVKFIEDNAKVSVLIDEDRVDEFYESGENVVRCKFLLESVVRCKFLS